MVEPAFANGERVRLARLEDEFFLGMDNDDIEILKSLIGRVWIVQGYAESGDVELMYPKPSGVSPLRWVWVPPDWIERIV